MTINVETTVAAGTAGTDIGFAAEVSSLSETDIDSAAGNSSTTEDDDFTQTVSVRPNAGTRTISGRAFLDQDNNGVLGAEGGVSGITVNAYGPDGSLTGTATTDNSGSYTITTATTEAVRLEFTGFNTVQSVTTAQSPPAGIRTVSSLAFLEAGTSSVTADLAMYQPESQAQFVTTCFVYSGQSTLDPVVEPAVVVFNADGSVKSALATIAQVGATNGLAVHTFSGDRFVAAFHKRHADIGPAGNSAIYRISAAGTVSTFIRLDDFFGTDSTGPYSHNPADWFTDAPAFAAVGKISLGDVDISEDGRFLYTINLATRELIQIPLGNGSTNTPIDYVSGDTRTIRSFPILGDDAVSPANGGIPTGLLGTDPADNIRPFALSVRDGLVYAGMVNTAETTTSVTDLSAYVFTFDPATGQFSSSPSVEFRLGTRTTGSGWQPWTADWNELPKFYDAAGDYFSVGRTQPWLTDIEFDRNGDMVLGFRDRTGDQVGHMVGDPTGADSDGSGTQDRFYHDTKGDILRLRRTGTTTWAVEAGQLAGDRTEYYAGDAAEFDPLASTLHPEAAQGGLAQVPGFNDVVTTAIDPESFWAGGTLWLDNADGTQQDQLDLFSGSDVPDITTFGKNNGLGDLEYINNLTMEIGNRVWNDMNRNGLQDAGEPALANVDLQLFDLTNPSSPVPVGTTTTDATGEYFFNSSNVFYTDGAAPAGLRALTSYEIRVAPAEFNSAGTLNQFRVTANNRAPVLVTTTTQAVSGPARFDSSLNGSADTAAPRRIDVLTGTGLAADGVRVVVTNATGGFARVDTDQTVIFEFNDGSVAGTFDFAIVDDRLDSDAVGFDDNEDGMTDRAMVSFTTGAAGMSNHSLDLGFTQAVADLQISKISEQKLTVEGETVEFVITVTNSEQTAETAATGVTITDAIPAGLTLLPSSVTATQGTFDGTTWTLPDPLAPGASATLRYQVVVNAGTAGRILTNAVQVTSLNELDRDSTPGNDDGDRSEDDEDDAVLFVGTLTGTTVVNSAQVGAANQPDFDSVPDNDDHDHSEDDESTAAYTIATAVNVFDFGDLPDEYLTRSASGGPSHRRGTATYLGISVDDETDGQPSPTAVGDGPDDDGIRFLTPLVPGNSASIEVTASTDGFLNAWIDFNADGILDEISVTTVDGISPGSPVAVSDLPLTAGTHVISVAVPATATGLMAARFRFTNDRMLNLRSPGGAWPNGEVEDYVLRQIGDRVWFDHNADGIFDPGTEAGLAGVTVVLSADLNGDGTPETYPTVTDANGFYRYDGLPQGTYSVTVTPPASLVTTFDLDGGNDSTAVVSLGDTTTQRADADFGYRGVALIGDTIWQDTNASGTIDTGEPGIAGIAIQLTGDLNGDSVTDITLTTTTDASGRYEFTNLVAGNYTVSVTPPAGLSPTFDADSTATPNTSKTSLSIATENRAQDFGYSGGGGGGGGGTTPAGNVDLAVTKTSTTDTAAARLSVTYTIIVSNIGTEDATTATVTDTLPADFDSATWTATGSAGTVFTASGTGSLTETVSLPAGTSITYTVTALLNTTFTGTISNTATVSTSRTDSDLTNNSATDVTVVAPLTLTPSGPARPGEPLELSSTGMSHVALVPFIVGTTPGSGIINGVPVGIADPEVFMVGFVCVDNRITAIYDVPPERDGQTLYFQSYEATPAPRLSNVVRAVVGSPRVVVAESGGESSVTEGSTSDSLALVLSEAPASDVTVSIQSQIPTRLNVSPATVTFTPANWNDTQLVSLQAADDTIVNGDATADVTISVQAGSDPNFTDSLAHTIRVRVTDNDVLQKPGLTESFTSTQNQQPVIGWSPVAGADSYDIWLSPASQTASPVYNTTVSGTSFTPPTPLGIGRFNVWVRARSVAGQVSAWSAGAKIAIRAAPLVSAIPDGTDRRPTISWNAVNGAVGYEIWVNNQTTGAGKILHRTGITAVTYTPPADLGFGIHAVWVRALGQTGFAGQWSAAESFAIGPELLSPLQPTFSHQPVFTWTSLPGADAYEIYLQTGRTVIRQSGLTAPSYTPSDPLTDGAYRWWIRGFAANGKAGKWSAPGQTTIGGRPTVLTPASLGTVSESSPLFEWTSVTGASRYSIYVSRIDVSALAFRDDTLTAASYAHTAGLASGSYRVWVRAISTAGTFGPWSAPVSFTVQS